VKRIEVIDSHTGGEPTRIIISGGPNLGTGNLAERTQIFQRDFDHIRRAVVNEPRGSDVLVGGLICDNVDDDCTSGIIFFNNVGYLGMCGHGTIGLMATLNHLGKADVGTHLIDTPVGKVSAELGKDGLVSVKNVASYRTQKDVKLSVDGVGEITGDVAWGGNWFFLVKSGVSEVLVVENARRLSTICEAIRNALDAKGISGDNGAYIDHVELFGQAHDEGNDSRNFVYCPGSAYDRSPCGTGTSAKLACLAADGKLDAGQIWKQESVVGSVFTCSYEAGNEQGHILPTIKGSAFVTAESSLILNDQDPFSMGIPNGSSDE